MAKVANIEVAKLGRLIDQMYEADQHIKQEEARLKKLKQQRKEMEDKLLNDFDKEALSGAKGRKAQAVILPRKHVNIKDRRKFAMYVLKNKALDLFQNRISSKAYFDRLEEGEKVPGCEVYESITVSLRKRK